MVSEQSSFQTQESIESRLLDLKIADVTKFCDTERLYQELCNKDEFWLNKLDRDFYVINYDGIKLLPSLYAGKYMKGEPSSNTYQRWNDFRRIGTEEKVVDIINFILDKYAPNVVGRSHLVIFAIGANDIRLLSYLVQYQVLPPVDVVIDSITNAILSFRNIIRLDTLQLLEKYGALPSIYAANLFAYHGRLDILQWLEERQILPGIDGANDCIIGGYVNILMWLHDRGILPDTRGANIAAEHGNLYVLNHLERHHILPTIEGYKLALYNSRLDVVLWLTKRHIGYERKDVDEIEKDINYMHLISYEEMNQKLEKLEVL